MLRLQKFFHHGEDMQGEMKLYYFFLIYNKKLVSNPGVHCLNEISRVVKINGAAI